MNAELIAEGKERIVIPTVYRANCLGALKALSRTGTATSLIRMLDYAQRYSHAIDWRDLDRARQTLKITNAFEDGDEKRLLMPPRNAAAADSG